MALDRAASRAILKIQQLWRIWRDLLDEPVFLQVTWTVWLAFLGWTWTGLTSLSDLSQEMSEFLDGWLEGSILGPFLQCINEGGTGGGGGGAILEDAGIANLHGKISGYRMVLGHSLLQLTGIYRRRGCVGGLDAGELLRSLRAVFAQSTVLEAFIEEIQADITE